MSLPESAPEAIAPAAPATPSVTDATNTRNGVIAAASSYVLWGLLPLLFHLLNHVGSVLVVAERTIWSLVFMAIIMLITHKFGEVRTLLSDWRKVRVMALSAALLAGNWLLYIWAIETGQLLEASFGYFINPLVNIVMGMVLLRERQNLLQSISIGIAVVAIAMQAIAIGSVPFIALGLALSFGFYGYFRKTAMLGPATGLFAETLMISPLALGYIGFIIATTGLGVHADPGTMALLILTGPATAVPLLLFAYGVQRLRLTTIGMFQYIAPSLQFLVAIFILGEALNPERLFSFGLIWLSLILFTYDSFRQRGRTAAAA